MRRKYNFDIYILFIIVLLVFIVRWLVYPGFIPTHDGEFHFMRFWQFAKMLDYGYLFPRWAPDLNNGYGVPLFNFYYPLPNYFGYLFHTLGLSYTESFKKILAICYLLSGLAGFFWLKKVFNSKAAIFGTLVSSFVPYWFVLLFVRGSIGEVMSLMFFIFTLAGVEYGLNILLVLSVGAIILSHNISAIIFLPTLFAYMLIRKKIFLKEILLGLGLSFYFWFPAMLERQFVQGLSNFDYRDHFVQFVQLILPAWGTGFSKPGWPFDELSQQIGVVTIGVFMMAFYLSFKENNRRLQKLIMVSFFAGLVFMFMMLSVSTPIWQLISFIRYIQYPWRFLLYLIPLAGLWSGYIFSKIKNIYLPFIIVLFGFMLTFKYTKPVIYSPRDDKYYLTKKEFTRGTTTVGNSFNTIWPQISRQYASKLELTQGDGQFTQIVGKPLHYQYLLNVIKESNFRFNSAYYQGWEVRINGKKEVINYTNGLIEFKVGPGSSNIDLSFRETPLRKSADLVSILCLFWVVGSVILKWYAHSYRHKSA